MVALFWFVGVGVEDLLVYPLPILAFLLPKFPIPELENLFAFILDPG